MSVFCTAPGIGEGSSTSETPQPPRKKRARVDPTVESVCISDSLTGFLIENRKVALLRNTGSNIFFLQYSSVKCYNLQN